MFYKKVDIEKLKTNPKKGIHMIPNFKTKQQETEYSCGPCSIWMALNYCNLLREGDTELSISKELGTNGYNPEPGTLRGTRTEQIVKLFNSRNIDYISSSNGDVIDSYEKLYDIILFNIRNGDPMLVNWSEYDGHWTVIIGIHTTGRDNLKQATIILADPYSPYEQPQRGYSIINLERFLDEWVDRNIYGEPRVREYVTVRNSIHKSSITSY